ncbi:putative E2 ubiquitin-conjugating enzyme [Microsporum canis]
MATALREHPDDIKQSVHAVKTFLAARLARLDAPLARRRPRKVRQSKNPHEIEGYYIDWCCGDGRLFGIWLLLARYDRVEIRWQASSSTTENTYTLARDKNGESSRKTQDSRGIGYADNSRIRYSPFATLFYDGPGSPSVSLNRPLRFRGSDEREDEFVGKVFDFVGRMIPGPANKNLPSELHAMLQLGLLLDKVADLLRNDSLDNVTKRRHVYKAAFGLVAKLGSHPDLIDLVKGARYHKQQTPGLKPLSSSKPLHESPPLVLGEKIETASSTKHYCP